MSSVPYFSAVESLMYAMVCTRPDISRVVSVESKYMVKPEKLHWQVVKLILRYLKRTFNTCLEFGRCLEGPVGYNISLIGYLFTLKNNTISWKATIRAIVALSTTEAKYMAIIEAVKEAIWLRGLSGELVDRKDNNVVYDSQSVIHLTKD
ncbi:Retrovirus-related Pol polyprotein from transposon TNT 1-94 [Gossypium australe]|uniref:Retrovirus-related Pol polyprotein from transposon TNT 1-94 n=1 Tax=Gossypium australe TaxID=47621 RepID=A0A5B6V8B2_9ROSI|nr:Retrovirus-related Pol polyprotein from transposon TNT 1-94 [Gossypium australe]